MSASLRKRQSCTSRYFVATQPVLSNRNGLKLWRQYRCRTWPLRADRKNSPRILREAVLRPHAPLRLTAQSGKVGRPLDYCAHLPGHCVKVEIRHNDAATAHQGFAGAAGVAEANHRYGHAIASWTTHGNGPRCSGACTVRGRFCFYCSTRRLRYGLHQTQGGTAEAA